jgi:ribosomal protein S18 acetylase RimI-like enzyme
MPDIPVAPSHLFEIREADLSNPVDGGALLALMEVDARDPMGGGQGLSDFTHAHLIEALASRPSAHVIVALAAQEPAGLLIGLEGFSTLACRPLLNIHDLAVAKAFRRQEVARRLGCCKLTLEVLEGNRASLAVYGRAGFEPYERDPATGRAQFWEKRLSDGDGNLRIRPGRETPSGRYGRRKVDAIPGIPPPGPGAHGRGIATPDPAGADAPDRACCR